jgi:hypothetical protein
MNNTIDVDKLLLDPINAVLFNEIYTAQQVSSEDTPKVQDVLKSSREELKRKKIKPPTELMTRVSKFKKYGIAIVLPGTPFTGHYSDGITLSDFGLTYVDYVERTLRTCL